MYVIITIKSGSLRRGNKTQFKNYEFPDWLRTMTYLRTKSTHVLYWGIRCEKFSVLMKQEGWEDVNQLHGGILNYAYKEGEHFEEVFCV